MKIDWKRKLSSRKLWLAVAGFISGVLMNFIAPEVAERVSGSILSFGSIVIYIMGESRIDAARIDGETAKDIRAAAEATHIETDAEGSDMPRMGF